MLKERNTSHGFKIQQHVDSKSKAFKMKQDFYPEKKNPLNLETKQS